jgi:hypothetical protein
VKRTPAGSGRAPVASGKGAEDPVAADGVRAAPVSLGRWWSCRSMWTEDRARAGRRNGARGPRERLGRCRATATAAAAWARRRRLRMRAGETERNETDAAAGVG